MAVFLNSTNNPHPLIIGKEAAPQVKEARVAVAVLNGKENLNVANKERWKAHFFPQWGLAKRLGYQNLKEVFLKWIHNNTFDEELLKLAAPSANMTHVRCSVLPQEVISLLLHHVLLFNDEEMLKILLEMPCVKEVASKPFVQRNPNQFDFPLTIALKQCAKNPACKTYDLLLNAYKAWGFQLAALELAEDNVLLNILSDEAFEKHAVEMLQRLINDLPIPVLRTLLQNSELREPFMPCFSVICYLFRFGYLELLAQIQSKIPDEFERMLFLNDYLNKATFQDERYDECIAFIIKHGGPVTDILRLHKNCTENKYAQINALIDKACRRLHNQSLKDPQILDQIVKEQDQFSEYELMMLLETVLKHHGHNSQSLNYVLFKFPKLKQYRIAFLICLLVDHGATCTFALYANLGLRGDVLCIRKLLAKVSSPNSFSRLLSAIYVAEDPLASIKHEVQKGIVTKIQQQFQPDLVYILQSLLAAGVKSPLSTHAVVYFVECLAKSGVVTAEHSKKLISTFADHPITPDQSMWVNSLIKVLPQESPPSLSDDRTTATKYERGLRSILEDKFDSKDPLFSNYVKIYHVLIIKRTLFSANYSRYISANYSRYRSETASRLRWVAGTAFENIMTVNVPDMLTRLSGYLSRHFLTEYLLEYFVEKEFNNDKVYSALVDICHSIYLRDISSFSMDLIESALDLLQPGPILFNAPVLILSAGTSTHAIAYVIQQIAQEHFAFIEVNTGHGTQTTFVNDKQFAITRNYQYIKREQLSHQFFAELHQISRDSSKTLEHLAECLNKHLNPANLSKDGIVHRMQKRHNCAAQSYVVTLQLKLGQIEFYKFYKFLLNKYINFLNKFNSVADINDEDWEYFLSMFNTNNKEAVIKSIKEWQLAIEGELKGLV